MKSNGKTSPTTPANADVQEAAWKTVLGIAVGFILGRIIGDALRPHVPTVFPAVSGNARVFVSYAVAVVLVGALGITFGQLFGRQPKWYEYGVILAIGALTMGLLS